MGPFGFEAQLDQHEEFLFSRRLRRAGAERWAEAERAAIEKGGA